MRDGVESAIAAPVAAGRRDHAQPLELERLAGRPVTGLAACVAARELIARGPRIVVVSLVRAEDDAGGASTLAVIWPNRPGGVHAAVDTQPRGSGRPVSALLLAQLSPAGRRPRHWRAAAAVYAALAASVGQPEMALIAAAPC